MVKTRLVFLGPPGSGKGTYAQRIGPRLGIPHISTGELFRENIEKETELGKKVADLIKAGNLVPDELTMAMVEERLAKDDAQKGFILDGVPRTIPQAEMLDKMTAVDAAVNMDVSDDIVITRLSARESCRKCSKIYNKLFLKPKVEGVCDVCGGELYTRKDDMPEVIRDRLKVYYEKTAPLINYYKAKGLLVNIPCDRADAPIPEMVGKILKVIQ